MRPSRARWRAGIGKPRRPRPATHSPSMSSLVWSTLAAQECERLRRHYRRNPGSALRRPRCSSSRLPVVDRRRAWRRNPRQLSSTKRKSSFALCSIAIASTTSLETGWLVSMLARRCMSPNHLWQDLGLSSRGDLNRLMRERFPALAARNTQNMKWKKFFYRCLCEMEGFSLCAAPSCAECSDYTACFGDREQPKLPNAPRRAPLKRLNLLSSYSRSTTLARS